MEHYRLQRIHGHLAPRTYVEVGLRHGHSVAVAGACTRSVGVDPVAETRFPLGFHDLPAKDRDAELTRASGHWDSVARVLDARLGVAPVGG